MRHSREWAMNANLKDGKRKKTRKLRDTHNHSTQFCLSHTVSSSCWNFFLLLLFFFKIVIVLLLEIGNMNVWFWNHTTRRCCSISLCSFLYLQFTQRLLWWCVNQCFFFGRKKNRNGDSVRLLSSTTLIIYSYLFRFLCSHSLALFILPFFLLFFFFLLAGAAL